MIEIVWLLKLASQSEEIAKNHNKIIVILLWILNMFLFSYVVIIQKYQGI